MTKINQKFQFAVADILNTPGALADRPRQVVSIEKLQNAVSSATNDHPRKPFAGHFLIAGGVGKTVIFGRIAKACIDQGLRTLIVEPRVGLTSQTHGRIREHIDPELEALLISGANPGSKITDQKLIVTTNQSLMQRFGNDAGFEGFDVILYDEAHNVLGKRNQEVLSELRKHAVVLGFTQSDTEHPIRSLRNLFGDPIDEIGVVEAIETGLLCPVKTVVLKTDQQIGLGDVKIESNGDYSPGQLSRAVNRRVRNLLAVQFYANSYDEETGYDPFGQTGFIYCADVAHAVSVSSLFNEKLHSAFASMYHAPDRLRDPRFKALLTTQEKLSQEELDHQQKLLIEEMLSAYSRGDMVTPIPCAFIHGDMTAKEQEQLHKAHSLGLIKLLSNAQLLREGLDRPSASLILNLSPTRSSIVNSQRGTRADRIDPDNNNKISMVVDFMDQDFTLASISNDKGLRRNRPKLFAEVLEGNDLVAPQIAKDRMKTNRKTPDRNITFKDPELKFNYDQIQSSAELMRSVSVGFNAPKLKERTSRLLTVDEMKFAYDILYQTGYSLGQLEYYAYLRNPLTLVSANALNSALRITGNTANRKPIDEEVWRQAVEVMQSLPPKMTAVSSNEVKSVRTAFQQHGWGQLAAEFVCRLCNTNGMLELPPRLFYNGYNGHVVIDRFSWEEVKLVAEKLQDPDFVRLMNYHITGSHNDTSCTPSSFSPLDTKDTKAVFDAMKEIFFPLGLNFKPKQASVNWTAQSINRIEHVVRHAIDATGESYHLNKQDFLDAARSIRDSKAYYNAYCSNPDLPREHKPEWHTWQEETSYLVDTMGASISRQPLSPQSRAIVFSGGYTEVFAMTAIQPHILPLLQVSAMYLYELTPSHKAPHRKAELAELVA